MFLILHKGFHGTPAQTAIMFVSTLVFEKLMDGIRFLFKLVVDTTNGIANNGMAPLIRSNRRESRCPTCLGLVLSEMDIKERPAKSGETLPPAMGRCLTCDNFVEQSRQGRLERLGDRLLVAPRQRIARWDIVAFRSPQFPEETFAGRVVGLPGEKIEFDEENLLVDRKPIAVPTAIASTYRKKKQTDASFDADEERASLPGGFNESLLENEYCVLADDARAAVDSASLGPILRDDILGVAQWIFWPPARFRRLS